MLGDEGTRREVADREKLMPFGELGGTRFAAGAFLFGGIVLFAVAVNGAATLIS
jgi:hypothetical protein